jgi:predicted Fe-Mo cluster-binding NifX family protein
MKIAVSCSEKSADAVVDSRFGRAPYFAIYDTETHEFDFIDNQQTLNTASGAGIQSAQHVVNAGVSALLTGHCGPKAFKAMKAADVKIYTNVSGTLKAAVAALEQGELTEASEADVEGHWA